MPIYEFYCHDCHTIFNFFSHGVDTRSRPLCPACRKVELSRRPSSFATLRYQGREEPPTPFDDLDEERLEGAMESLLSEMGDLEEDESEDPRRLAHFFRRFGETTGLELGPRMEELLARLDAGQDPDTLEDELGDEVEDEEALEEFFRLKRAVGQRRSRPRVDDTLYFL